MNILKYFIKLTCISIFIYMPITSNSQNSNAKENKQLRIGAIKDITPLAHSVCNYKLQNEIKKNKYILSEGDICPVGGGDCKYSGIININGVDVILTRLSESENSSTFKSSDVDVSAIRSNKNSYFITVSKDGEKMKVKAIAVCDED